MGFHPFYSRAINRGFTLVETLLALTITAMISATVASMLFGVSASVATSGNSRDRLAARDVASYRLNNLIRGSGRVLAAGSDYLVLWTADANNNQKPNLAEIRRFEFDSTGKQLRSYAAPATLVDANNTTYELTSYFSSVTTSLKGSANFVETQIMPNIQGFAVTVPTPLNTAKLINYTITLSDAQGNFSVQSVVALHSQVPTGN
jgi:prepilin-type N-terminal cleavage/methylation domain-containing protein